MSDHISLGLPLVPPAPFNPRRTMDPYAICWCGSGRKWKWCHKDRERQSPIPLQERLTQFRATFRQEYCSHPDAGKATCSAEIVRAHTVQHRGGLSAISENGRVVSAVTAAEDLYSNKGEYVPRVIGIKSASTFLGFCGHHDTTMFRPIETGPFSLSAETVFLLSFRALAYELYMKRCALAATNIERECDKGKPFEDQCSIQEYLHWSEEGMRRALADLERWKAAYDTAYMAKDYDKFDFYAVGFTDVLPFVGCGGFHPQFDFSARPLQQLGRGSDLEYQHVTVNLTVIDSRSVAVIGWNEGGDGPAAMFAKSFAGVRNGEKAEAVRRLVFEHIENVFMLPSWWRGLSEELRLAAIFRMRTGSPGGAERKASCLMSDGLAYLESVGVQEVCSSQGGEL